MDATASQNQCIQLVETSIEEHQKDSQIFNNLFIKLHKQTQMNLVHGGENPQQVNGARKLPERQQDQQELE